MDSKENEPQPTSFQAGAPMPVSTSMREPKTVQPTEPDDDDESIETETPSMLDHLTARLKAQERVGLLVGVGIQLVVLLIMIVMGSVKAVDASLR